MKNNQEDTKVISLHNSKQHFIEGPDFGEIIRSHRLAAHLEQEQVAKACGTKANTISNWERKVSKPDLKLIPVLCETLHIPLEEFFGLPCYDSMDAEEKNLINNYRYLTEPNKKQCRTMIQAIMESQDETRRQDYQQHFCHLRGHECGLAAGFGAPLEDEAEPVPVFVRISRDALRSDDIFGVNGHSMEPRFPDGSKVFVKRMGTDELYYGDIVACLANNVPFIKVYEKDGLHSLNKDYKTIRFTEEDNVRLIGRVVGIVPEEDLATPEETQDLMEIFSDELN